MDDRFIARQAELEMEAKRRGVPVDVLLTELRAKTDRPRRVIPMTMRAQA